MNKNGKSANELFKKGDTVELKQPLSNKPRMIVHNIVYMTVLREAKFIGIRCRWFSKSEELQEAIFNSKDLVKINNA